ncbi:hypothetical protein [Chondromyces crocatus]|uniref:Uncharacterized protein n=1 Tax=Chondromyces crocatus TaxID=52 RepID=A0A0K1E6M6_CHOCO|nr:hypothetical protein [Chondromyces crocatus]AKT36213.1 uncharacterized protein CMC5_003270 [Chondromyces crocatus]
MGRTIRKDASTDAIVADARTARIHATARGGAWQTLAEQRLAAGLAHHDEVDAEFVAARALTAPLVATRDAARDRAHTLIGRIANEVWNAVGRPRHDSALALIFPGGIGYYVDGDMASQANRMQILSKLLISGLHPQLPAAQAQAASVAIAASAQELGAAVEAAAGGVLQIELLQRVRLAIVRNLGIELSHLKRLYKAAGFTEADIHDVIPHRPRKPRAQKPTPQAPVSPTSPASSGPDPDEVAPSSCSTI